jgi:hypothetical protein
MSLTDTSGRPAKGQLAPPDPWNASLTGKEKHCLRHLYIKLNASFYQDRLGTNIGKTQKRVAFP